MIGRVVLNWCVLSAITSYLKPMTHPYPDVVKYTRMQRKKSSWMGTGVKPSNIHGMDHLTRDPYCEYCKRASRPLYRHLRDKYGTAVEDQTPTLSFDFPGPFPVSSATGARFMLLFVWRISSISPSANGVAERWVDLVKIKATVLLAAHHLSTAYWNYAVAWVTYAYNVRVLDQKPKKMVPEFAQLILDRAIFWHGPKEIISFKIKAN